jgi:cobalt-zinc-cadmium efflux system membrane fusion protein
VSAKKQSAQQQCIPPVMPLSDHPQTPLGRAFLWGGIGLGLLLLAGLFTKGFGLFTGPAPSKETPALIRDGDKITIPDGSPLRARLTVDVVAARAASAKFVLPALVESDPARTAAVLTPLGGRVVDLRVALGERVRRGQLLAVIDSADLAQAFDDNDKASDAFRLTAKNLARQEEQDRIGAASHRDLDQARSDHEQAAAEYTRTRARLAVLGAPADARGRSRLLQVRAPFDGSVTSLGVARGALINDPTQPMMTIADLSTIWITALVPEKDLAFVAADQPAEVVLSAYPSRLLRGKVIRVSDVVEADSRRTKVRIAFPNVGYALKPNMFATVTLFGPERSLVVLPTSALLMNNDRTTVFVATRPWTFERRAVDLQLQEGSTVAIESGVKAGEQVVVKGGILLND